MWRSALFVMVIILALAGVGAAAFAADGGRPMRTALTGAAEVPGPGDADGSGRVTLRFNPGREQVCFTLTVEDIAPATAAHVHKAPAGVAGPVFVGLNPPPTDGDSSGCVHLDRDKILAILHDPSEYYVNVHNGEHPAGAVRGQLGR
jgi:hypothetical protein